MKTPTWDEIREFLKCDGWLSDRSTGHEFFEKTLADGEILQTHISHSGSKAMSPGRFKAIISRQLKVSEAEFWEVMRSKKPASRPSRAPEPAPNSLPLWLAHALEHEVGLSRDRLAGLSEDEARRLLVEARSRARD